MIVAAAALTESAGLAKEEIFTVLPSKTLLKRCAIGKLRALKVILFSQRSKAVGVALYQHLCKLATQFGASERNHYLLNALCVLVFYRFSLKASILPCVLVF